MAEVTLYGPDNRPIDRSLLKKEIAAPTLSGVRSVMTGHPAQGLTPQRLASILRGAEDGDPLRYLELAEEMEEKDLHYLSVIGTRKRAVAQLDITVVPASDAPEDARAAELVEAALGRDCLEDEVVDILDAVGKGYSATEIVWDMSERQWMPARLEWRDPRWFELDRVDGRTLRLRTEEGPQPLPAWKFVTHHHKAKSGLPIRGGLARAAAWGYLFKNYDLKDWIAFIEVYGMPLRVGKFHPSASDEDKAILLRAVANIGTDAAAIVPESMMIEFVETGASRETGQLYKEMAEYIDKQISKAVLGQTLTTEVGDSGSYAAGKVHDGVRGDIERSDAKQLAATLNRDLMRPLIDLNLGPRPAYPHIEIARPEQDDMALLTESVAKLVPLGLRVSAREIRGKLGLEDPKDDDELLSPAAPPRDVPPGAPPRDRTALAAAGAVEADSVDALILELLEADGWEPVMEEVVAPLREVLGKARTPEAARAALAAAVASIEPERLTELLARAGFAARLAGETGANTTDSTTD